MNIFPLSFLLHSTTNTNQAKQSTKEEMVSSSSPLLPSDEEITVNPFCGSNKNQFISSCCILLSSAFHQTPLHAAPSAVRSHSKPPNPNNIVIIQDLQRSLFSTADTCLKNLNSFAASNPLFQKLFSISQNFQNFCEIRRRNCSSSSSLSVHNFAAILPGDSVAGLVVANGVSNFLNLYNTLIVVRLVLTWFPNSPPAIVGPLSTICDPYLNIFRGLIPPLGGTLDLSPILAFVVLNALTSTASALPAELPDKVMASEDLSPSHQSFFNLTTMQKKWMRFSGNRSLKNSGSHN